MSSPEHMFEQLRDACTQFCIEGEGSIDTGYNRDTQFNRTMRWTIKYGYSNDQGSKGVHSLIHSLAALATRSSSKPNGDPVAAICAPYEKWLKQVNEILPLATPVGSKLDIHINKKGSPHLFLVGYDYRPSDRNVSAFGHMNANTWDELEWGVLKFAIEHQTFSFWHFQKLMPVNQQKVLDVLNAHPVHNEETAQMWARDLANQVISDNVLKRIKKM